MRAIRFRLPSPVAPAAQLRGRSLLLVATLALAACTTAAPSVPPTVSPAGTPTPMPTPTAVPTPTVAPAPSGTTLMRDGFLHPGVTYSTAAFAVRFTLAIPVNTPDNTWLSSSTGTSRQLHVGQPAFEGVGISFYLPTGGYDTSAAPTAKPADFAAWISADPQLKVLSTKATQLSGLPATRFEVAADPAKIPTPPGLCPVQSYCVLVASTAPDVPLRPMLVFPEYPAIVYVVNLPSGDQLLINIDADPNTQKDSDALLQSIQFMAP